MEMKKQVLIFAALLAGTLLGAQNKIDFKSNSPEITVRYTLRSRTTPYNLTQLSSQGMDLYTTSRNGAIQHCLRKGEPCFGDTLRFEFFTPVEKGIQYSEYHLYLPLCNEVEWIEIKGQAGKEVYTHPQSLEKQIVVFPGRNKGILCASRPGKAWTNILDRISEHPVVMAGSPLQREALAFIIEDGRSFPLDSLRKIREKSNAPIILGGCETAPEGIGGVYCVRPSALAIGPGAIFDAGLPNDEGMQRIAEAFLRTLRKSLNENVTAACTQNRDFYCWKQRHEKILELAPQVKPQTILIGDSIFHRWSGEPDEPKLNRGKDSWDKLWKKQSVLNLGFGWDRIENMLWRIFHGELDGYQAKNVVILAGTNNLSLKQSPEQIVNGINQLERAVRRRQPQARIFICGLLPRSDKMQEVKEVNALLEESLKCSSATYIDMSAPYIDKDGKFIASLFSDGLHPNQEGYVHFAKCIKKGMAQKPKKSASLNFPKVEQGGKIAIAAHRGFWKCEEAKNSQNSLASLKLAQENGFWGSEFDIHLTLDKKIIVNHDPDIEGLDINRTNFAELSGKLLPNGEKRPCIGSYLDQGAKAPGTMLVVEFKRQSSPDIERELVEKTFEALKERNLFDPSKVMFISFSRHICRTIAWLAPAFVNQYLNGDASPADLAEEGINGIDYNESVLRAHPEWVQQAHEKNMSVNVWTVDRSEDMQYFIDLGVDAITTNRPLRLREILSEKEYAKK